MQPYHTDRYIDDELLSLFDSKCRDTWNSLDTQEQHKLADKFYTLLKLAQDESPEYCQHIIQGFIEIISSIKQIEDQVEDTVTTANDIFEEAEIIMDYLSNEDYFYGYDIFSHLLQRLGIKTIWSEDIGSNERKSCSQTLSLMLGMGLRLKDPIAIKTSYENFSSLVCSFEAINRKT